MTEPEQNTAPMDGGGERREESDLSFGKTMKAVRIARRMIYREVAEQCGKSIGFISDIEHDRTLPTPELAIKIEDALGITDARLLKIVDAKRRENDPAYLRAALEAERSTWAAEKQRLESMLADSQKAEDFWRMECLRDANDDQYESYLRRLQGVAE